LAISARNSSAESLNDSDVIVVDAGHYRTDARQIIAEIKKLTDKPVRYVINTHSHDDHISGDEIYRDAFPGVEFICHTNARDQIMHNPTADDEHRIAIGASSRNAAYGAIHTWGQLFKFVRIPRNSFDLVVG
jgi:glyoxylase-like metal-dependent hydrolase (beta-lactamase superfamily II)